MLRLLLLAVVVCVVPSQAYAQLGCGAARILNESWQLQPYRTVESHLQTARDMNICPIQVQVEGWLQGVGGATMQKNVYVADIRMWTPVPTFGTYYTRGNHWVIWFLVQYHSMGTSATSAYVRAVSAQQTCESSGGVWTGTRCDYSGCPLIVDVNRNGYQLTSLDEGVTFDLDADGQAERIAWTAADSDDAFVGYDRLGRVRDALDRRVAVALDGRDLLSTSMRFYADQPDPTAANGFEALKALEGPTYGRARADGVLDAADEAYDRLFLWTDANHDGVGQPDEVTFVRDAGILLFETEYKLVGKKDPNGNAYRQQGFLRWQRSGRAPVYDIWLRVEPH
jgi:hypothetical protein